MSLTLDPKTTALVLIDLEHAIVSRQLAPHAPSDVVSRSAQLAEAVRASGGTAVYVHVLITDVLSLPADRANPRPVGPIPPEASELVPEAGFHEGDVLITKRQWGAFYGTNLEQQLRRRGIRTSFWPVLRRIWAWNPLRAPLTTKATSWYLRKMP